MKILLLTQYFPPEFGAAAARNSEHARCWAEAGHQVEVLTACPNYPTGVIPQEYRGKWGTSESKDGYTVVRTWIYATPNRTVWRRAFASLSFLASAFYYGWFRCARPDVIIASSGPFFVGPLGWLLSVVKRTPFVLEVRDLLPQQAIDVGMIKNGLLIRLLETIERFLYRRAARIVTVAEASRRTLVARGTPSEKTATIENGIQEEMFYPAPKDGPIRDELGWRDKFVGVYMGAHGVSQGLHTLIDAADQLRDLPDVRVAFVGDGAEKPALCHAATSRALCNVEFLPIQDKSRVAQFYAAADVCFVPLRKGPYFETNIPSKMFEIMACARPIILGARGQARKILEEADAGIAVEPEDAGGFAAAVRRLRADPQLARHYGESGRAYVMARFARRRKAREYLELLEQVVQRS